LVDFGQRIAARHVVLLVSRPVADGICFTPLPKLRGPREVNVIVSR
jgi:hypothetical protein